MGVFGRFFKKVKEFIDDLREIIKESNQIRNGQCPCGGKLETLPGDKIAIFVTKKCDKCGLEIPVLPPKFPEI